MKFWLGSHSKQKALVNVIALCPLSLLHVLLAESSDHCVSLPRLLFLLCQAGTTPGLPQVCQLLFRASGNKHLRIHKEKITIGFVHAVYASAYFAHSVICGQHILGKVIWSSCNITRFHFNSTIESLSVYLTPVDFNGIREHSEAACSQSSYTEEYLPWHSEAVSC